jgi:hypothetical protein
VAIGLSGALTVEISKGSAPGVAVGKAILTGFAAGCWQADNSRTRKQTTLITENNLMKRFLAVNNCIIYPVTSLIKQNATDMMPCLRGC